VIILAITNLMQLVLFEELKSFMEGAALTSFELIIRRANGLKIIGRTALIFKTRSSPPN